MFAMVRIVYWQPTGQWPRSNYVRRFTNACVHCGPSLSRFGEQISRQQKKTTAAPHQLMSNVSTHDVCRPLVVPGVRWPSPSTDSHSFHSMGTYVGNVTQRGLQLRSLERRLCSDAEVKTVK